MNSASSKSTLSNSSVIIAAKEPIASEMPNEVAILNPKTGMYFGLDHVGARIWELIQEPKAMEDIRDAILSEYEVGFVRCEQDLYELIRQLSSKGLIEVRD